MRAEHALDCDPEVKSIIRELGMLRQFRLIAAENELVVELVS